MKEFYPRQLSVLIKQYNAEQRLHEISWFYHMANSIEPKVIVEIGIKQGGNLKILSTLLEKGDLLVGMDPGGSIDWDIKEAPCTIHYLKGDSHSSGTKEKLIQILMGRPIDVLFIDGDHSYEGMLQDYKDYSSLVRLGGLIAVHDIYYLPDVIKAWKVVKELSQYKAYESPFAKERWIGNIGIGILIKE